MLQGLAAGSGLLMAGGLRIPLATAAPRINQPGSRPDPSKPEGIDLLPQVEHIIIYMQENHSWDAYFGMLGRGDGFTLDGQGNPTNSNLDVDGKLVTPRHQVGTCPEWGSAGQNWNGTHKSINGGAMDGFAKLDPESMHYWDRTDLPFYYGLAETFVLCDRWFASAPAQTHPNRRFLQAGTAFGMVRTSVEDVLAYPDAPNGVIWERLSDHGISWTDYCYDLPDIALFPNFWQANKDHVSSIGDFLADCRDGTLPMVSIVSPGVASAAFSEEDRDIQRGESYSSLLINAVMDSPNWAKTVMFFTYDEHGGEYDHVPPPAAITPDDIPPRITVPPDEPGGYDIYGLRVPSVVISPFAKKDHVSSVVHDHTSILRFIETKFNLGALTRRDANASDLLDTLDFSAKAFAERPELPAPALPDAHSLCEPGGPELPTATPRTPGSTTTTTAPSSSTTTTAPGSGGGGTPASPATAVPGSAGYTG